MTRQQFMAAFITAPLGVLFGCAKRQQIDTTPTHIVPHEPRESFDELLRKHYAPSIIDIQREQLNSAMSQRDEHCMDAWSYVNGNNHDGRTIPIRFTGRFETR